MRPRLNLSLRRALMAAMATACTLVTSTAWGGVADARYDLQYYLDFARNKGMFAAGATNISVFFKNGSGQSNPTIPLMPNLDSYAQRGQVILGSLSPLGGANLMAPQYVNSAYHCPESDVYFLSENGSMAVCYSSTGYAGTGAGDWSMQRLNKIVTEVAYTPMASEEFLRSLKYGDWLYRLGNGGSFNTDGVVLNPGSNALGGMIDVNSVSVLTNQGDYRINASLWQQGPPLEIGVTQGDSGSPVFAWDAKNNRFLYLASLSSGNPAAGYGNYLNAHNNPEKAQAFMDNYTINVSGFSGADTITWGVQNGSTGKGELTQGETIYEYTGSGTANSVKDHLGLTFSTEDTANVQTLELQGSVNMGAGALTFDSGSWKLTETDASHTFNSAGFVVNAGAELTLELTAGTNEEWRKVGEGIMTIAGSGDNNAVLRVGGGETKYIIETDEAGNITGCTLGNAGETRLARQGGYAASSVRLEGGVAIIVLMEDGQFKTNTTAGDTFTFGNAGGLLNLNGHDLTWGVINQQGSGSGARIGNFTPLNEDTPGKATFTYTGTGTFQGCFMDEGADGAQLAVNYNNADGGTWVLTGNHSNAGGFTVSAGTMVLQGSNTPHVMMTDSGDWTYATMMGTDVTVKSGATFRLSHHALMNGNVTVEDGGAFVLNQTVNAASESINGSLRQDMTQAGITSLIGDVILKESGSNVGRMEANISSPVTTILDGHIRIDTEAGWQESYKTVSLVKTGTGVLSVTGTANIGSVNIEEGGLVIGDASANDNWYHWTIGEKGFLAAVGANNLQSILSSGTIVKDSKGVLALTADQSTQLTGAAITNGLYIGAYGDEAITYGTADAELAANTNGQWLLGGGTGTLVVDFLLTGSNDLIIGNEWSSGTVHLNNTENDFKGNIYIKGLGNKLTYENGALGNAKVSLSYGNAISLYDASQFEIFEEGSSGVLAMASADVALDMSGKPFSLGANGDITYTGKLTVGAEDTYRFGGVGNLTLDTDLNASTRMELDGQGISGSSVTFARQNAFAGDIVAGGGLYLDTPNSSGSIAIHAGHAEALAATESIVLQKGASLYTDGQNLTVRNLSVQSGAAIINNCDNATTLTLEVSDDKQTSIVDGALSATGNLAGLHLIKTGDGSLSLGKNTSWSGGLTIKDGTVKVDGYCSDEAGLGASNMRIEVEAGGTLDLQFVHMSSGDIDQARLTQYISGNGTVRVSSGGAILFSDQAAGFTGTVEVAGNTRLYIGTNLCQIISPHATYDNLAVFKDATVNVTAGSQARITNMFRYGENNNEISTTSADFVIAGTGFAGNDSGTYSGGSYLHVASLNSGALSVDLGSVITGDVTLAEDATISSWSNNVNNSNIWGGHSYGTASYGLKNKLGGTIRGRILGEGKTLTLGGNEGLTFTADSANTYGDLVISNGNGNNNDQFALRLNGGAARNQTSTALGKGTVTLNGGLILRLAGTGTGDNTDIVYTYENNMSVGAGATLQSYNITNRLTGLVTMTGDSLNLATANGGVLEMAGGIQGSGTLNVAAGSKLILGSAATGYAVARGASPQFSGTVAAGAGADITLASPAVVANTTTFTGTDTLTLRFGGTADFTLGGISLTGSQVTVDEETTTTPTALTLHFDFTNTPVAENADTWNTLTVTNGISADSTTIVLDLNMFSEINSGSYTLISGAGNGTAYSLADTMNGRLSLSTETGDLVLTVGGDNRLYWRGPDGTSRNWTEANWYSDATASQGLTAFTPSANVMLDATGVAEDNSATARETINLGDDALTVGTIGVQDAAYELTGVGSLSATSLTVGNGADLKLSNTGGNTFANGIVVNDATLTISSVGALSADVSVENDASFAMEGGSMTGKLTVTDAAAAISDAALTGNIKAEGTGSLSLSNATFSNAGSAVAFDFGSLALTAGTKLGGTYNWTENDPTVQVQNMSISGGNVTSTVALQADGLDMAAGKVLFLSGAVSTSLDSVTGAGSLAMQSSGNLQLGDASLLSLSLLGGTTNVTGAVSISGSGTTDAGIKADAEHLSIGKATLNIEEGGSITVARFTAGNEADGNSSVVNINGGTLTITGSTAGDTNGSSFLLAHWKTLTSVLTLNSGAIVAQNATMHMGWDSGGTFKALGGEATLKGVLFGTTTGRAFADTFHLGTATEGSAKLKIGASGFTGIDTNDTVALGEGTIAATADFAISGQSGAAVQLIGTVGGTIFDTNGHTITVNTAISGGGKLTKRGTGKLALAGSAAAFTGQVAVEAGALAVDTTSKDLFSSAASVSLGASTVLDLSAIDFTDDSNTISLGAATTVSFANSATVALGNLAQDTDYSIFNASVGLLDGWMNLSAENFTVNGVELSDMGRVSVSLGMLGTFSYSIDSWDLVWNGGESGNWNTVSENWQTSRPNAETGAEETINTAFVTNDNVIFNSNAAVTLSQNITANEVTIADNTSVSLDESAGKLTAASISVGEGATLSLNAVRTDANIGSNISGSGTVVLSAGTGWSSVITMGDGFTGETHLQQGQITLVHSTNGSAVVGSKLVLLADGAEIQLTNIGDNQQTSWAGNLELRGTHDLHSNSNSDFIFTGNVTGTGSYIKKSTGKLTFGEDGTVNLGKFKQEAAPTNDSLNETYFKGATTLGTLEAAKGAVYFSGSETTIGSATLSGANATFGANGSVSITTATISAGTVNFDGETNITTATLSGGTLAFNGKTEISAATFSGGTTTFSGDTILTTANFNGGTVNFATDSLSIDTFNRGAGNVTFKLASGVESTTYTVGGISGANAGTLTIDQGVTVNATSITTTSASVSRSLVVNGELNISQNLNYNGYYSHGEKFAGNGVINVTGDAYILMYDNEANFEVNEFNIGGNFILDVYAYSAKNFNIKDGTVTVEKAVDNTRGGAGSGSDYAYLNIAGGSLVMEGGATMSKGQLNIRSGSLVQAGGESNISNTVSMTGGELSVTGGTMNISSTAVTGSGGTISVSGGELALGTDAADALLGGATAVSLTGGVLDLSAVSFSAEGGIALGGAMSVSGGMINLSRISETGSYAIFDLTSEGASLDHWENMKSNISVSGVSLLRYADVSLSLTDDAAVLSFASLDKANFTDLLWAGGASGDWDQTSANWDRTTDDSDARFTFVSGDSVSFNTNATITLSSNITAKEVTITNGATISLVNNTLTANKVSIGAGSKLHDTFASVLAGVKLFDLAAGAELGIKYSGTPSYTSEVTGDGTIVLSGGGSMTWNPTDGTLNMGTLTIKDTSTTTNTRFATTSAFTANAVNIMNGSATFGGTTTIGAVAISNGTLSFNCAATADTVNVTGGAMKVNFTSASGNTITDNANGSFTVGTLNYTGGTLEMSGTVNITTLKVGAGLTATVYNNGATAGQNKTFGTVELGEGAILKTHDNEKVSAATDFGSLKLMGNSASIEDAWHAGYYHVDSLTMGAGVTSSTLELKKTASSSLATVFELGNADDTTSNFAGTINLNQTNTGKGRSAFVVLSNANIAQNAVVTMSDASDTSESAYIGLGINADNATIAGLESKDANGSIAKLFSGTVGTEVEWTAKSGRTNPPSTVGDAVRTLNITTKAGGEHAFYGEVLGSLNLVIDGEGTQKFLGTSNSFNGTMAVQGGTAAFNDAGASLLEHTTAFTLSNEGVLDLSAITFGTDAANAIALASGAIFTFDASLDNDTDLVIDLGNLQADTEYHIFDTTTNGGTLVGWDLDTLDLGNFRINGALLADTDGYVEISLGDTGTFSYTLTDPVTLYWKGSTTGNWNTTDANWDATPDDATDALVAFEPGVDVVFNDTATNKNVTLASDISVGNLTIESGAYKFAGAHELTTDTLTIAGSDVTTTIGSDGSNHAATELTVNESSDVEGTLDLYWNNATLNLKGLNHEIGKVILRGDPNNDTKSALNLHAQSATIGSIEMLNESSATFGLAQGETTATYNVGSFTIKNNDTHTDRTIKVEAGVNLSITDTLSIAVGNTLTVDGNLTIGKLTYTAGNTTLNGDGQTTITGATTISGGKLTVESDVTFSGSVTLSGGTLLLDMGGTYTLTGNIAKGTNSAGMLEIAKDTTLANNGKVISAHLVLNGGDATVNGDRMLQGNVTVKNGSTLTASNNDTMAYSGTHVLTVEEGGVVDFGSYRQTMGSHWEITLTGGEIRGAGGTYSDTDASYTAAIDNYNDDSATFKVNATSGDSEISATTGLRKANGTLEYTVAEDATLIVSGAVRGNGSVTKKGDGKLTMTAANTYANKTTISGGTLELQGAGKLGAGDVSIAADAALTAATTAVKDAAGNVTTESETWASMSSTSDTAAATVSGATITQTEATKTLAIATRSTDGTRGTMANTLVQIAADATLTVDSMIITPGSRISGAATAYTARAAESSLAQVQLSNSILQLDTSNSTVADAPVTMDLGTLQATGSSDAGGALTLGAASKVLTVSTEVFSNLALTSGTNFVVDFSSLLASIDVTEADFVYLSFADTVSADWSTTTLTGTWRDYQMDAYYSTAVAAGAAVPNVGVYFYVRTIPEPTSTTLSILALAALAARRRRK